MKRIAFASLLALSLAACGDDSGDDTIDAAGTQADAAAADAAAAPTVSATVTPDTVQAGDTLTVDITTTDFTLTAGGVPNVAGQGHYHIYLDGAFEIDPANYIINDSAPSVDIVLDANITEGVHYLAVVLMDNMHAPLAPVVSTTLAFTVTP